MIAEYFNDIFRGPSLMPSGPLHAAKAKLIGRIIDFYIGPFTTPLARTITRGVRDEAAITKALETDIPAGLDYLELHLSGGSFAVGDRISIGDAAVIPHMFHFNVFLADFDIKPLEGRPKLAAWWDHWRESDIVARSHARMQASLDFLRTLPGAPKTQK